LDGPETPKTSRCTRSSDALNRGNWRNHAPPACRDKGHGHYQLRSLMNGLPLKVQPWQQRRRLVCYISGTGQYQPSYANDNCGGAWDGSWQKRERDDAVIDRGAAHLDSLAETEVAERVQKLAAMTGRWRVNRVNDTWVLIDEEDHVDFEDTSLGSVAFLLGMYADASATPDTVIERYYGDLFEHQE